MELSNRLRDAATDKERRFDWKHLPEIEAVNKKLGAEIKQQDAEEKRRARIVDAWRRDPNKLLPSRGATALFEEEGTWWVNADKTQTGTLRWVVPRDAQDDEDAFSEFIRDVVTPMVMPLRHEPFWFAIGYEIGGVAPSRRKRYDRLNGKMAIISHWYSPFGKRESAERKAVPVWQVKGRSGTLSILLIEFENIVADRVIAKGLRITAVQFLAHFGPARPDHLIPGSG
jgi:hypothetical protein